MITDRQLKVLVGVVLVVLVVTLGIQGKLHGDSASDIFHSYSYLVSALAIILYLWNHFLWHWWPLYPYLHKKPYLKGTWKGLLRRAAL